MNKDNFLKTSDGVWIYHETVGKGEPVVLIHGLGSSTRMWEKNIEILKEHYQVTAIDMRGHGRSMKSTLNNTLDRVSLDIKEVIDHLGLENVLLVGHSVGGSVISNYAELTNEYKLKGLLFVDASLYAFSDEDWNNHRNKGFNVDVMSDNMASFESDHLAYAKPRLIPSVLSEDDRNMMYRDATVLCSWVRMELLYDIYMTDTMSLLSNRTIAIGAFATDSPNLRLLQTNQEIIKRATKAPITLFEQFDCKHHMFNIVENEKFTNCVIAFNNKINNK